MKKRRQPTPDEALARCEELCARAEYCEGELRRKLYMWGVGNDDSDRIIGSLRERRFVDDARFAEAFVREKVMYAGWGRRKVAAALYQKRVARDVIAGALDGVDPETYERRLEEILMQKRRTMAEPDTYDGRTRLFRFAASRGFEPDLAAAAIRRLGAEHEHEDED